MPVVPRGGLRGALPVIRSVLALFLLASGATAGADAAAIADEVEREGIDMLYVALAAAVTAVAGWLAKRPQDYLRDRKAAQNGAQAPVAAHDGKADLGQIAYDAIKAHELKCEERLKELHARVSSLRDEVRAWKEEQTREQAELAKNLAVVLTILQERQRNERSTQP